MVGGNDSTSRINCVFNGRYLCQFVGTDRQRVDVFGPAPLTAIGRAWSGYQWTVIRPVTNQDDALVEFRYLGKRRAKQEYASWVTVLGVRRTISD
jgi:hypothetical protein